MKVVSAVSLLVVLVVVLLIAKQQMRATSLPTMPGAASSPVGDPRERGRQMEKQVADDVQKALQSGMQRNDASERKEDEADK